MDWVGIRANEMRRAAKIQRERTPLVSAKVTKHDVIAFWEKQGFNLKLQNNNGDTPEGNCDLCFLKGNNKVLSLIAQKPERAVWWAKMESLALASRPSGFYFRTDRPSYAQMMNYVGNQVDMFAKEEDIACFCGD